MIASTAAPARPFRWAVALLALAWLGACGESSPPPSPSPAPPSGAAAEPDTETTPELPASPAPPDFGSEGNTAEFALSSQDGHRATLTITWYEQRVVSIEEMLPACQPLPANRDSDDLIVYYAVAAEVRAVFHETDGFAWPPDQDVPVDYDDGRTTQYWDRAAFCHDSQSPDQLPGSVSLTPDAPHAAMMWMESREKTPDNPDGELDTDPDSYRISADLLGGTCDGPGGPHRCISRYGDEG